MPATTINAATSAGPLLQSSSYYETVSVVNNSTGLVWVSLDGTTPTAGAGSNAIPIPVGGTATFGNSLPRRNNDQLAALKYRWTAQQNADTYTGGFATNVNVIAAVASGTVTAITQ